MGGDVTALLKRWREGDADAQGEVYSVLYDELRRQARTCMRRESEALTLETTALVHEVFVRLADADCPDWQHRVHFLAVAARAMRRVLVDLARTRRAGKRCTFEPCTSTMGLSPVTVTVSSSAPRLSCALTLALKLPMSLMPSRFTVANPASTNVTV